MSNLTLYVQVGQLPDCCKDCPFHNYTSDDYHGFSTIWHYCERGVAIPVTKKSCKVKQKYLNNKGRVL